MRIVLDVAGYSICFCSWSNFPYEMYWKHFATDEGYPEILFYWWKFYFTSNDF